MATKTCTKCGREYPATAEYFYRHNTGKGGLRPDCKKCWCIATKIRYENNREKCYGCQKKYQKTFRGYVGRIIIRIKQRCTNSNCRAYKNYGGRGIRCLFTVDELYGWLTANNINPRGLCIHRINNDGNYTLDNITFLKRNEHTKLHSKVRV